MRINTNIMALNAQNKLTVNQSSVEKSIQKLSSGLRINGAADDAAGLAISEKMRSQIRGLDQAETNAQDGISMLQTAEGALQQTTDILQRMRELVVKAQNTGVLTEEDKTSISNELSTLRNEIDRIATSTTFNGKKLLNGDMGTQFKATTISCNKVDVSDAEAGKTYTLTTIAGNKLQISDGTKTYESDVQYDGTTVKGKVSFGEAGITVDYGEDGQAAASAIGNIVTAAATNGKEKASFKIGANTYQEDILSVGIRDMSSKGLSADGTAAFSIAIDTSQSADETLKNIDYALASVSSQRANLGVVQNRMEYAISNLSATSENLSAAESRIRDVDMAEEMVKYTKSTILNQSAMAMLSQANQQPQTILSLLS